MDRSVVIIARRWSGPLIKVEIHTVIPRVAGGKPDVEVTVAMSLAEFVQSLSQEIGSPALLLTEAGLRKSLTDGAIRVIDGMKAETVRVM